MVAVGSLGTWALFVGPSMHTTFDTQMRTVLDSGVFASFSGTIAKGDHAILAKTLNDLVASRVPKDSSVTNIVVSFANGQEIVSYSFWGSSGVVSTNLSVVDGRVVARGTSVDCPLCMIESGDEMEATFNDSLNQIPTSAHVTSLKTENDALVLTIA